ncbi:MAG TPA: HIT family protein [Mobilitalea sp.]|nr:HIT family protein [Mobilitalea sp.]
MENCIFCKITAGEIPSSVIYEDDDFKVILDIAPAAKGHAIILPKKHFADIFELDEDTAKKVLVVAKKVAAALKKELNCDGLNLLQNNGQAAGQSVFHIHFHLIPRYHGDNVKVPWTTGKYEDGEAKELAERIAKHIN